MQLNTPVVTIKKNQEEVFNHLSDLKNFEQLMPSNVQKFKVDGDSFLFALSGMPEIRLVLKEKIPTCKIILGAASSKLDFTLNIELNQIDKNSTAAQLLFDGKFNPMMTMMVKKPLTNFINSLSDHLKNL